MFCTIDESSDVGGGDHHQDWHVYIPSKCSPQTQTLEALISSTNLHNYLWLFYITRIKNHNHIWVHWNQLQTSLKRRYYTHDTWIFVSCQFYWLVIQLSLVKLCNLCFKSIGSRSWSLLYIDMSNLYFLDWK